MIRVTTKHLRVMPESSEWVSDGLAVSEYVQLEVSDTGCGIPLEDQARVFDPFFTTKSAGHGLGLAVVQGIVRGLGGSINVVSAPGKGTAVQVLLPCAHHGAVTAVSGPLPPAQEPQRYLPGGTILVVEDEEPLRRAVVQMLRKTGYSVIETADGSAAMEVIQAQDSPIDVLVLDITIPGTSSREVYEEAKRLRPKMRMIVTSAYGEDFASNSFPSKIDHFIRKPYRLDDLMELMQSGCS